MNTEEIIANIKKEKEIVKELLMFTSFEVSRSEKVFVEEAIRSLIAQLKILSDSVSGMLKQEEKPPKREYQRIITSSGTFVISKELKEEFIKQLGLEREALKKIRKKVKKQETTEEIKKLSPFVSFASKFFRKFAFGLIEKGYFESLKSNLQKANMPFLASSYVSLTFLITFLVLVTGFVLSVLFSSTTTLLRNILIASSISIFTFIFTINYPSLAALALRNKIDDELPFAVSHMSAIASSNVEPSKIFPIMSKVKEYPFFAQESKKVVNQMNIYGYDLVTALKNVSKNCASEKLAELFNGIAATTKTGGSLVKYLQEKSKDLLLDYKLRRQKYSEVVGVLSDIYTALLIAAPLILMLILTIIGVVGSNFIGMSISNIAILGVAVIVVLNIFFLIFIHITQPKT
ncbi:MAG: type II secretion system F family protein [Candidatus Pacearchaeota archaeon]